MQGVCRGGAEWVAFFAKESPLSLAKNHAFMDGNKRAAFLSIGVSLSINGHKLVAGQVDAIQTMLAVAAGALDEKGLADWIQKNSAAR